MNRKNTHAPATLIMLPLISGCLLPPSDLDHKMEGMLDHSIYVDVFEEDENILLGFRDRYRPANNIIRLNGYEQFIGHLLLTLEEGKSSIRNPWIIHFKKLNHVHDNNRRLLLSMLMGRKGDSIIVMGPNAEYMGSNFIEGQEGASAEWWVTSKPSPT